MNILIQGVGKTGTTALFYAIREALSGAVTELFEPGAAAFDAAFFEPREHVLAKVILPEAFPIAYERFPWKIMTARDPRDILISRLLYLVWHAAFLDDAASMSAYLTLLRLKERDPGSIPVKDLFASFAAFQRQNPYREYLRVLAGLTRQRELLSSRSDFFVQRYEDFIAGRLQDLMDYLGGLRVNHKVEVHADVARVARRKGCGDWRHWFTPEDVDFFRPMLAPSMQALGYADDWRIAEAPSIDPRHCSEYALWLAADRRAHTRAHWPAVPASLAEILPVTPEALVRLTEVPALRISTTPERVIEWGGESLAGDVAFQFHFDGEGPDRITRLYLNFGEGFSDRTFLILPAMRGNNLVVARFRRPVVSLRPDFALRELQIHRLSFG